VFHPLGLAAVMSNQPPACTQRRGKNIMNPWACIQLWWDVPVWQWWEALPENIQRGIVWWWSFGRHPLPDNPEALWLGPMKDFWLLMPDIVRQYITQWC